MLKHFFSKDSNKKVTGTSCYYMMYTPQDATIARHIDYYWIVNDATKILGNTSRLLAYPGITPDMIIVLDGYFEFDYLGKRIKQSKSRLFSFIHHEVRLDLSKLKSFILVKFKSRALGALQPFIQETTADIMQNPMGFSASAFNGTIGQLEKWLRGFSDCEKVSFLDFWFLTYYKKEREGFVVAMAEEISEQLDLQEIMTATNYSYSTIERHFKRETGLTPKKYQSLRRSKRAIYEICATKNKNWMHYVNAYNYYDQAHFIHDIKRYTKATPSQLLEIPSFVVYRPKM